MNRKRRGRGEGSIYQRADGLWVGSVSLGYKPNGKRDRRTVYGDTKQEVQQKLRLVQASYYLGELKEPSTMTVAAWLTCWLDSTVKPRCSPTTYERREQVVRLHLTPHLGHLRLQKVEPMHVHGLLAALERKGESLWNRQSAINVLNNAFAAAKRFKLVTVNPLDGLPRPKPAEPEMVVLSEAQLRRFLAACRGRRLAALFVVAAATGLRQGELLGLAWQDIDFDAATVAVRRTLARTKAGFVLKQPKSKSSRRTVTLPPAAVAALREHRKAMLAEGNIKAPVFCTRAGGHVGRSDLRLRMLRPILARANAGGGEPLPEFRFHDLRHTHASLLLRGGGSLKAISKRLGHADVGFTLRTYCHLLPDADELLAQQFQAMLA
jgi:integrase